MMAALFLALVSVSHPLVGATGIVALIGSSIVARRVAGLARCFRDCGGFSYDLGGRIRISVSRPRTDCSC